MKTGHESTEYDSLKDSLAGWFEPLRILLQNSLPHMPPEKRKVFAARAMQGLGEVLGNFVGALSKDASQCSNGGWDEIKAEWPQVRNDYLAAANRLRLQNAARSLRRPNPEILESFFQASALASEQGNEEDWRALEVCKEYVADVPEAKTILDAAMTLLEERESERPAEPPSQPLPPPLEAVIRPAVNFYLLTRLGDALFALLGGAVRHEQGVFVPVLHKGDRRWQGVLDVSADGEYIAWYSLTNAERCEDGLEIAIVHRDTGQRRGMLRLQPERNHMDWQPAPPAADR
jgi:hypothetical protein